MPFDDTGTENLWEELFDKETTEERAAREAREATPEYQRRQESYTLRWLHPDTPSAVRKVHGKVMRHINRTRHLMRDGRGYNISLGVILGEEEPTLEEQKRMRGYELEEKARTELGEDIVFFEYGDQILDFKEEDGDCIPLFGQGWRDDESHVKVGELRRGLQALLKEATGDEILTLKQEYFRWMGYFRSERSDSVLPHYFVSLDDQINREEDHGRAIQELKEMVDTAMQSHANPDKLLEQLIQHGVAEVDAQIILKEFEDLADASPTKLKTKNVVYHINDRNGKRKILKFVTQKEEAEIEAKVNYYFSRHPMLAQYIPRSDLEQPIAVLVGDSVKYLTVQEEVIENAPRSLGYWIKALARMHVYGSQIMNALGVTKQALGLAREKDDERLEEGSIVYEASVREDTIGAYLGKNQTFIHRDFRRVNRRSGFALDWGHAGWGEALIDLSALLLDYELQAGNPFTESDYKNCINAYLNERNASLGVKNPTVKEVEVAYHEFTALGMVYAQAEAGYVTCNRNGRSPWEIENTNFLLGMMKTFEGTLLRLYSERTK